MTAKSKSKIITYSVESVIKMMPLIISYCSSLEDAYVTYIETIEKINELRKTNKNYEIYTEEIETIISNFKRWEQELGLLNLSVCNIKLGRINIPIIGPKSKSNILLCVHKNYDDKHLEWHSVYETHEASKPYLYQI